jgi:signal transduction histidine kinase
MKTRLVFFICFLFGCASCVAQYEVDSQQKQLSYTTDSLHYTDVLNRLAMLYSEINADSSFYYAGKAYDIAQRLRYKKGEADAANNLGIVHDLKGNMQQALHYFDNAYSRYSKMHDVSNMIQTTLNIAIVFYEMEKLSKAHNRFKTAFALSKNLKQDSIMSFAYANYVTCFAGEMTNDSIQLFIQKSKQIAEKYKDYRMMLFADQLTAEDISSNHPKKAIAILQSSLQNALSNKYYYTATDVLIDLGDITADSAKAVQYYLQSLSLCKQKGFTSGVRFAYEKLYDFYQEKGDDNASLLYSEKLLHFYHEQKNIEKTYGIDYMDYALKSKELESSLNELKFQQRLFILIIVICILCIVFAIILWRYAKKLKKAGNALKIQFQQSESTAESLDKLNKNYARVIKVVAHDLRNPVSNINMISEMIDPAVMTAEEIQDFTGIIRTLSKNCFDLIDQLLNANLNEEQKIIKSPINLNHLLSQCVRLLNFKAKEKKQQITFSHSAELLLLADADKLTRVITNLVMNAIKFSPEESTIRIKTFLKGKYAILAIIDQGIGIPANLQHKIFDPFTSARRPGTKGETTFGLGLYISKSIIEAHGGIIWFNCMPGKGTAFYVQLPLLQNETDNTSLTMESMQEN